jgi:hypothetical protein
MEIGWSVLQREFETKPNRSIIARLLLKYNPFFINASFAA